MALAAACGLAACSTVPELETTAGPALRPAPKPSRLRHGPSEPALADERLNTDLLRRFYARRGFAPVWTSRPAEAEALVNIVLRAGEHGLDPELFQAEQLQRRATLPPPDRDVLLSAAFLSYAEALAQGAVPADQRRDGEALSPEPVDVVAALDAAMDSADPAAAITALAPATPAYRELRQALQLYRAGELSRGAAAAGRLRRIEVNLERQRWLPRQLPTDRVWVNVADQQLELYLADRPVFSTRIVVGQDALRNQSPEFRTAIEAGFLNPPWVIPRDIVTAEILPRLLRDPDYLERNNMLLRPNGEVEQAPGPEAGLGQIMFDMPNRFDVYLHDTPDRSVFERDNRRISHGCIRVQNPLELAALLMRRPIDSLHREIATGSTSRANLPTPVAVFVTYQTVFLDSDGTLQFRPDFYNRDLGIWRQLRARPQGSPPRLQAEMRPSSSAPVPL